jgi:GrpB-like predicted nucleotidyltransferase (UPF0157 family)
MEQITLQPHDATWKNIFAAEKQLLLDALQPAHIHHVGSPAVPDLLAKHIIDIAIEATVFPPTKNIIEKLSSIGYEYRGEAGVEGRHWFTKGDLRKINLHYCAINSPIVKNQLAFRDSLIRNEQLRREYEAIKTKNATGKDIDDPGYALAKSSIIKKVIGPAGKKPT